MQRRATDPEAVAAGARERLGQALADVRQQRGHNQRQAAQEARVAKTRLQRIERGREPVTAADVRRMLRLYDVRDERAWLAPFAMVLDDVRAEVEAAEAFLGRRHDPADPFAIIDEHRYSSLLRERAHERRAQGDSALLLALSYMPSEEPAGACGDCGATSTGYGRHEGAGEPPCKPCRDAHEEEQRYARLVKPYRWAREQLAEFAEGYKGAPPEGWAELAACRDDPNPEAWYPETAEDIAHAMSVCGGCPVQRECLAYALAKRETLGNIGVWGQTVEADRHRLFTEFDGRPECGTHAMYQRHRKKGEEPCDACRRANWEYEHARRIGASALERDEPGA